MSIPLAIFAMVAWVAGAPVAMAGAKVYVPLGSAGEVLVIDSADDRIVATIGGLGDVHGLGAAAGGQYLVAGSYAETAPGETTPPAKPEAMSEDEHAAHHPAAGEDKTKRRPRAISILSVISVADGAVVRRVEVPGAVHHVAVSPDGRYAIATHPNDDGISVTDLSTFAVSEIVRTGPVANYAVVSPDGALAYISNTGNGTVSEIDTSTWIVRRNIMAGGSPEHMVLSPDGRTLYVANIDVGTVTVLSLAQGRVEKTYFVGGAIHGIDLSDDARTLFVSGEGDDKLVAIDLATGEMRTRALGPAPYHLAVVRGAGKLYVSSQNEPKIWVVDTLSLEALSVIPIRGQGHQMVVVR